MAGICDLAPVTCINDNSNDHNICQLDTPRANFLPRVYFVATTYSHIQYVPRSGCFLRRPAARRPRPLKGYEQLPSTKPTAQPLMSHRLIEGPSEHLPSTHQPRPDRPACLCRQGTTWCERREISAVYPPRITVDYHRCVGVSRIKAAVVVG